MVPGASLMDESVRRLGQDHPFGVSMVSPPKATVPCLCLPCEDGAA